MKCSHTQNTCFMQVEMVDRVHFTTRDTYTCMNNKGQAVFKCKLSDPDPKMPPGFEDVPDTKQGDYLMVQADSIKDLQRGASRFKFNPADKLILTAGWEEFDDSMGVADLQEDFLLYYQQLNTKTASCKEKPTARETTKESESETHDDEDIEEDIEEEPTKQTNKKGKAIALAPLKNTKPAAAKRKRVGR